MSKTAPSFWRGKTYWLVGASEGLGRSLAFELSRSGATLYLSARSKERLEELAEALPGAATAAPMDVRDRESVEAAFDAIPELDGVIYCAGVYEPMAAQDWDKEAVETMFDVNLIGAARVLGAVLPNMVARGHGHIVLIGSLAGLSGLPNAIGYGASKAGLIHLAESLRADLLPTSFNVQVVNPGFIETRLTAKNDFRMPGLTTADDAARRTRKCIETGRFRTYFPYWFAALFRLARFIPDWLYFGALGATKTKTPRS